MEVEEIVQNGRNRNSPRGAIGAVPRQQKMAPFGLVTCPSRRVATLGKDATNRRGTCVVYA